MINIVSKSNVERKSIRSTFFDSLVYSSMVTRSRFFRHFTLYCRE